MYAQCPECLSVFSLSVPALVQAHGQVVCGHCGSTFDSLATLREHLPPEPFRHMPANAPAATPLRVERAVYRPPPLAQQASGELEDTPAPADYSSLQFAPRFAKTARTRRAARAERRRAARRNGDSSPRWPWVLACSVLTLLLAAECAWIERDALIRAPMTGSMLRSACNTLGCRLPLVAAPKQLRLLASDVETHPNAAHALMISLSLRNDAPFAQPWPVVVVTLSDAQGHRVAMRRLRPVDYLNDPSVLRRGLASGATTALLLEVQDPGNSAVAYQFDFE